VVINGPADQSVTINLDIQSKEWKALVKMSEYRSVTIAIVPDDDKEMPSTVQDDPVIRESILRYVRDNDGCYKNDMLSYVCTETDSRFELVHDMMVSMVAKGNIESFLGPDGLTRLKVIE